MPGRDGAGAGVGVGVFVNAARGCAAAASTPAPVTDAGVQTPVSGRFVKDAIGVVHVVSAEEKSDTATADGVRKVAVTETAP